MWRRQLAIAALGVVLAGCGAIFADAKRWLAGAAAGAFAYEFARGGRPASAAEPGAG